MSAATDSAFPIPDIKGVPPFETEEEWREFYEKFGANGRTFQDFTELTPQSMEVIYMVAFNHYNAGKYDDAEKVFQLLSMLNHFEKKYWKGLGASREAQGKFELALQAYGYLGLLDIKDPYPPLHAAKCLLGLNKIKEAESALRAAAHNASSNPEHSAMQEEAEGLLTLLANKPNGAN